MSDTKNYNTPKILTMIDEDDHLNMNFRNPDVFFFFFFSVEFELDSESIQLSELVVGLWAQSK